MTTNGHNSTPRPDDADLLAFVEGHPLPREREVAVLRALDADPMLARQLELLRADRAALMSLADEPAPAGLIEAAEAALERGMLLGLEKSGTPVADRPPVSLVRPMRRGFWETFMADRAGRQMAAAAAVLLVAGGATYFTAVALSGRGPVEGDRIAILEPDPQAPTFVEEDNAGGRLADTSGEPAGTEPGAAASTIAEHAASPAPAPDETPTMIAAAPAPVTAAQAVDLARERRLVIRVSGPRPERAAARVEREAARSARPGSTPWLMRPDVPSALLALIDRPAAPALPEAMPDGPSTPAIAAREGQPPASRQHSISPFSGAPRPTPDAAAALYIAEVRLDEAAIESVARRLGGGELTITFEALDEPLPADLFPEAPPVHPDAVLWWSRDPGTWRVWASVPVVVEARPLDE